MQDQQGTSEGRSGQACREPVISTNMARGAARREKETLAEELLRGENAAEASDWHVSL